MADHKREYYIPTDSALLTLEGFSAVVYLYASKTGKLGAVGFYGKAQKPAFNYTFKTPEHRSQYCAGWLCDQAETEDRKSARKAEKSAVRAAFVNPFKLGDVLHYSWGWEQTNPEFYQVVEVKNKTVILREIGQIVQAGMTDSQAMADYRLPEFDKFIGEPIKKLVQPSYDGKSGSVSFDYGCGSYWGTKEHPGRAVYCSWYG